MQSVSSYIICLPSAGSCSCPYISCPLPFPTIISWSLHCPPSSFYLLVHRSYSHHLSISRSLTVAGLLLLSSSFHCTISPLLSFFHLQEPNLILPSCVSPLVAILPLVVSSVILSLSPGSLCLHPSVSHPSFVVFLTLISPFFF